MKRCTALTDHATQPSEPDASGKARRMKSSMKLRRGLAIFASLLLALLVGAGGGNSARANQSVGTKLHIDSLSVGSFAQGGGWQRSASALVFISDEFGNPVDGALVTGDWSGCFDQKSDSATTVLITDPDTGIVYGRAMVLADKKTTCVLKGKPCDIYFGVTNVAKSGYTYDPTANVVGSKTGTPCM